MTRRRILLVEDDADLRRMFRQVLSFGGFDVEEAGDGLRALHQIDNRPPDALVLDLGLPIISGQTVRAELAAQAHTRQIPVIVVTGDPGDFDSLNVACLLRKPVSPDRLLHVVQDCIARGGAAVKS
ncbi:MAG TPA: response regulator [Vicinamibacterales bacterium]